MRGLHGVTAAVAALAIVALALFAAGQPASAAARKPVPMARAVDTGQCDICHQAILGSKNPNLIFTHGAHLLVACEVCHQVYAHTPSGTVKPTMGSCFNCHFFAKGAQAKLAKGGCSVCHPASFNRKPSDHLGNWAGQPHIPATYRDPNRCALCHTQAECKACHDKRNVVTTYTIEAYIPSLPTTIPKPPFTFVADAPPSQEGCSPCHKDFDRAFKSGDQKGRVRVNHLVHQKRLFRCLVCHPKLPHLVDRIDRVTMRQCFGCHGTLHSIQGRIAKGECTICHPKTFVFLRVDHRPPGPWLKTIHGLKARQDLGDCYMCHKASFCIPCHARTQQASTAGAFMPASALGSGTPRTGMVVPDDHKTQQWRVQHGKDFMRLDGRCSPCHTGVFCYGCHKTPMPHLPNWLADHGPAGKLIGRADCDVCHADRSTCQTCHHMSISDLPLVPKNCVKCHPTVALPWRKIRSAGLAVHAVHWKSKYGCQQCHSGFATDLRSVDKQHSYSFDMCRACHGTLNAKHTVTATPTVGPDLCRDCHPKLRL
jgi:hypothetical protein